MLHTFLPTQGPKQAFHNPDSICMKCVFYVTYTIGHRFCMRLSPEPETLLLAIRRAEGYQADGRHGATALQLAAGGILPSPFLEAFWGFEYRGDNKYNGLLDLRAGLL